MFDLQLRRVIRFRRSDKKFSNYSFRKILAYNVKKRIDVPLRPHKILHKDFTLKRKKSFEVI